MRERAGRGYAAGRRFGELRSGGGEDDHDDDDNDDT
jgi:hypothetical protein